MSQNNKSGNYKETKAAIFSIVITISLLAFFFIGTVYFRGNIIHQFVLGISYIMALFIFVIIYVVYSKREIKTNKKEKSYQKDKQISKIIILGFFIAIQLILFGIIMIAYFI